MFQHLTSFNLQQWVADHRDAPRAKRFLWEDSNFWAFVTSGPNDRTAFHVNPGDEIFHQLEGETRLHFVRPDGQRDTVILRPGEVFLLPAGVPHSPRREAGSWTLVITSKRTSDSQERWFWYCEQCGATLHEVGVVGRRMSEEDIVAEATRALRAEERRRTCTHCGHCSTV